jgi:hypothetical protein
VSASEKAKHSRSAGQEHQGDAATSRVIIHTWYKKQILGSSALYRDTHGAAAATTTTTRLLTELDGYIISILLIGVRHSGCYSIGTPRAKHVFFLSPADVIYVIKEKFYSQIMYAKFFITLKIVC